MSVHLKLKITNYRDAWSNNKILIFDNIKISPQLLVCAWLTPLL